MIDKKLRAIIRDIFKEKIACKEEKQWEDYYHESSNIAHHNLVAIRLILNDNSLLPEEKIKKILKQYEIYTINNKSLITPK